MDPEIQDISKQTEVPVPPSPHHSRKMPILLMVLFILFVTAAFSLGNIIKE